MKLAGVDAIALTKLDVLDGFGTVKVVTAYRLPDGSLIDTFPADAEIAEAYLEAKLGVPAVIVSTGPRREETLVRGDSELTEQLRAIIGG